MLRRLIAIIFGFVVAATAGSLFLAIGALIDPTARESGFQSARTWLYAMMGEAMMKSGATEMAASVLGMVFWAILIATCIVPLIVAALVGELAGMRAWAWYAGASAAIAAALPWIAATWLAYMGQGNPMEGRVALFLFLTGMVTGSLYWIIAGREARPEY